MSKATSAINQFFYRPELIQVGTLYQYVKSNIDGSYPARVFIYVRDNDHLEVLKFEEHGVDAALVKAHMDWDTFCADRLESWVLTADGRSRAQASLSSSYADPTFTISWQDRKDVVHVNHYPVHVYNFDLISLNYALRHWQHPEEEITIGVLQPSFDTDSKTMMKYEGTVMITYLRNEAHNGQICRRYRIRGEGLRGCEGTLWLNRKQGYVEDIEIPIADNPDWDNFKFQWIASTSLDAQQWADFMNTELRNLKGI